MAKISDEIRNDFVRGGGVDAVSYRKLLSIADRIDAEMMELPKDADGMPIHVGDTVWNVNTDMEFTATSITLYANGVAKVDASCEGCHAHTSPSNFAHTRPDSWERIADELDAWRDVADVDGDACKKFRALADRIRKLAEKESE